MIYLLDDKKHRQIGYGWTKDKFDTFKDYIIPIYDYKQILDENLREKIFSSGNIVLFHESFFDSEINKHIKDSIEIRSQLEKYSKKKENFLLAIFSGSKNSRSIDDNVVHLPVSLFYKNLEIFIEKHAKNLNDLRVLLFGQNPEIEEYLLQTIELSNQNLDELVDYSNDSKNLYFKPNINFIQKPLLIFDEVVLFNKVTDSDFDKIISQWLTEKKYQNIFIPLCFGKVLSDFNGLRFALHIRTTKTINQVSNIFIYSVVDYSSLVQNEYFDILKIKNVKLINYKRSSFKESLFLELDEFIFEELSVELDKIKLNPPSNYFDNHSIANVWGVYQLARNANIEIDDVEGFEKEKLNDIYFKWLIAKNNLLKSISEEQKIEQLKYAEKLQGVKVLGKIDLTKIKGK